MKNFAESEKSVNYALGKFRANAREEAGLEIAECSAKKGGTGSRFVALSMAQRATGKEDSLEISCQPYPEM